MRPDHLLTADKPVTEKAATTRSAGLVAAFSTPHVFQPLPVKDTARMHLALCRPDLCACLRRPR